MAGVEDNLEKFLNADRIIIVACGTSWHAGLVAEYVFEEFARIPVEVEYASEFRYRNPIKKKKISLLLFLNLEKQQIPCCYKISQRTWRICVWCL
jgi:glucosamine 6-phosphate synthetase-like amidotransferase/phosphosugar isomerase protein